MPNALLDTGPLVALFKKNDHYHTRAVTWFRNFRGSLLTTLPVLTEAWHLVSDGAQLPLCVFSQRACRIYEFGNEELERMNGLLAKYRDISMDLTDASLVVLAQESGVRDIATTDQRDFSVFRTEKGKTFNLLF